MTSLGWAAEAARVMQSQGWQESYTILDALLLKGGEYAAKYNLGYDVPYDRSFYRCEAILVKGPWAQPSEIKRGIAGNPKVWDVRKHTYYISRERERETPQNGEKSIQLTGGASICFAVCAELTRPVKLDSVLPVQRQERSRHTLHRASESQCRRRRWRTVP